MIIDIKRDVIDDFLDAQQSLFQAARDLREAQLRFKKAQQQERELSKASHALAEKLITSGAK